MKHDYKKYRPEATDLECAVYAKMCALDEARNGMGVIATYGGCVFAVRELEAGNMRGFLGYLKHVMDETHMCIEYRESTETIADALRIFCELCFVDPMLIEAALGYSFEAMERDYYRGINYRLALDFNY